MHVDGISQDVHVTAYSPLGTPDSKDMMKREETPSLTEEQTVVEVAKAHDKHPVQVCAGPLKWLRCRVGFVGCGLGHTGRFMAHLLTRLAGADPVGHPARHQRDPQGHVGEPSEGVHTLQHVSTPQSHVSLEQPNAVRSR